MDRINLDAVLAVARSVADRLNDRARRDAAERIADRADNGPINPHLPLDYAARLQGVQADGLIAKTTVQGGAPGIIPFT